MDGNNWLSISYHTALLMSHRKARISCSRKKTEKGEQSHPTLKKNVIGHFKIQQIYDHISSHCSPNAWIVSSYDELYLLSTLPLKISKQQTCYLLLEITSYDSVNPTLWKLSPLSCNLNYIFTFHPLITPLCTSLNGCFSTLQLSSDGSCPFDFQRGCYSLLSFACEILEDHGVLQV